MFTGKKSELIQVEGMKKGRGRPKIILVEIIKKVNFRNNRV